MPADYKEYREKYSELVEMEREEEMRRHRNEIKNLSPEERQDKGRALLHLKGRDEGKGLAGKYIVKFLGRGELPDHELSVGDLIVASKDEPLNPDNPTGTVIERTNYSVSAAFDQKPPGFIYGKGLRIDLYVNDIIYQRMLEAIDAFDVVMGKKRYVRGMLLGELEPRFGETEEVEIKNEDLDSSQRKAVRRSLEAEDMFLIHGPPGTGKTTAMIETIEQHVERGYKVLATADSNVAVDNIVDFLNRRGFYAVRVGHPARVTETLREHTLDYLVEKKEKYQEAQEIWSKVDELNEEQEKHTYPSGKYRRGMSNKKIKKMADKGKGSRGVSADRIEEMAKWIDIQETISRLVEKAKKLEDGAVDEIIDSSDVVCTTNSTAGSELMQGRDFDVVMIDEATQATEPSCLIPMNHANKVVMAGDHRQLPPTILNQEAKEKGLDETLFERMLDVHGTGIKEMLQVQYRMNTDIMDFPSEHFYGGELTADGSVADHKLDIDLGKVEDSLKDALNPENVVVFIDTEGKEKEQTRRGSTSKYNPGEADIVEKIVNNLLASGIDPQDVGVISPYDDQVTLLNQRIDAEGLEIKTVDGFQGRQKDVIILSFVRSNNSGNIGFLEDMRRLNVSITRARKKLIMIGDSETLRENKTYKELIGYVENNGKIIGR